jgi:eukaryotic-like serine/threonine-protein kinase
VPVHAAEVLERLMGQREPCRSVAELRQELEAIRDRPATVSRLRRAGHLALMILLLQFPCGGVVWLVLPPFLMFMEAIKNPQRQADPGQTMGFCVVMLLCCGSWITWAFLFRGGYAFWRGGIAVRRADGRKASRLQCALRALLVWAPVASLIILAGIIAAVAPSLPWLYFGLWGAGVLLLLLYVPLALVNPQRGLHDWIAGTYLVPA